MEAPVIRQGEPQQPVDTEVLGLPKGPTRELQLRAFRVLQVRTVCTLNTVAVLQVTHSEYTLVRLVG